MTPKPLRAVSFVAHPFCAALARYTLFVWMIWYSTSVVFAQSPDSLRLALSRSTPGTEAFHTTLFKLVDEYRSNCPDTTLKYCQLSLRHNRSKVQPHHFHALYMIADAYSIKGQFTYADSLFNSLEAEVALCGDSLQIADYYNCRGINHIEMGNGEQSIRDLKTAYEYIRYSHPKDASKCLSNIASLFSDFDQEDSCLFYNLMALEMRLELQDTNGIETSLSNIGTVYFKKKMYRKTLDHTHAADALRGLPPYKVCAIAINMVNSYKHLGMRDSAFHWSDRSIRAANRINSPGLIAKMSFQKGELFRYYGEYDSSLHYMLQALPELEAHNDSMGNRVRYYELGQTYLELKRYREAVKYLGIAYRFVKEFNDPLYLLGTMRSYGQARLGLAGLEDLEQWYIQTEALTDSIHDVKLKSIEHELLVKYETEKSQRTLVVTELALKEAQWRLNRQRILITGLILLGILSLLISAGVRRLRKYKRQKLEEERRNRENEEGMRLVLSAEEKERQRIARELHDGLGQRLGLIQIKLETLREDMANEAREVLSQMQSIGADIRSVSEEVREISHAMMPAILVHGNLIEALNSLMQGQSASGEAMEWTFENHLPANLSIPQPMQHGLYRVSQEAIANGIRHGKATHIRMELKVVDGRLSLVITDNGGGFDIRTVQAGLGLSNIRQRILALGGTVSIQSNPGQGCRISILVPLEPAETGTGT